MQYNMVGKNQNGATCLQEEVDLLQKPTNYSSGSTSGRNLFREWKYKLLHGMRINRSRCVLCIQIQHISNLPLSVEGRALVVGWKTKGSKGEHTNPVHVNRGSASFDEIFLHYCGFEVSESLKSCFIWVSLVDSADCDLGTFHVDLSELANAENSNSRCSNSNSKASVGGKAMSFVLGGVASGGVLNINVYCRMMDEDSRDGADRRKKESKGKCFSCLPDLSCLRAPPVTVLAKRIPSLRSDRGGFITIENSNSMHDSNRIEEDEDVGFITIEKGTISASSRSRRPPSDNLANTTDDDEEICGPEDEKPCLMMDLHEDFDLQKVEDEFLTMLEDKYWKKGRELKVEPWRKDVEDKLNFSLDLSIDLDLDLDLDSLIKEAEIELAKAEQSWKSKIGGAILEKQEYNDLMKRWGAKDNFPSEHSFEYGFGSPI
ncbi:light-independent protochlorophyllide reductase subunit [Rhynchospora pubera]|uniref:Light-independent protochlorophyllide reductase subunit n=1 Tax=Rhynchospora pubera TaxID=906938 RepID=A0AAV8GU47_9POAL|nr:light-independent protochlorophyllide reductase subunit [Rhynchospora pubera]KAJ4805982.1 light-independent protochlorophyllide reductase subunit [Rhynchospora pubera]